MAKILVIDDEKIIRERLKNLLNLDGYETFSAENGMDGIEIFEKEKPDIAVIDIKMPGMDGIDVLKIIRHKEPNIEVILITGHGGADTAIEALKEGAFSYLQKPIEYDELAIEIKKALEKQEMHRKLDEYVHNLEETITARDKALNELEEANKALIRAKKEADQANKAKSVFLTNMSHELRTPLNGILGYTQIELMNKDVSVEYRETFELIQQCGEHLYTIIQDILDIARIEAGGDSYKEDIFSLSDLVQSAVNITIPQIKEKGLKISVNVPDIYIQTDKSKIRQVLINLLSNACKFTHEGGIKVDAQINGDQLKFLIEDTGIGIPPEKLEKVFEPFFQVNTKLQREYEGVGLGLALCNGLVNRLGGEIFVESTEGAGSKFYFTIKLKKVEEFQDAVKPLKVDWQFQKNFTILMVEDDEISRSVAIKLFNMFEIKYLTTSNGEEALKILRDENNQINLILMDIQMPGMDGYKTTACIKSEKRLRKIPIIAITAYARNEDRDRCIRVGCNDYISKPFGIEDLLTKLKKWSIDIHKKGLAMNKFI